MLLDTNVVIELFKGDDKLASNLDKQDVIYISPVVLGELFLGARRSANVTGHLKKINDFADRCTLLTIDSETAANYSIIKANLLKKGNPIPENDIWIAATARQHKIQLLTKDKHFRSVTGIKVKYW